MKVASTEVVQVVGERVLLRELVVDDVGEAYVRWMTDGDVLRHLEARFQRHTIETLRQFVAAMEADEGNVLFGIFLIANDRHIGNIKLGPVIPPHGTADIGLLIGERDCWGRGYATEAVRLVARYAFDTLALRKVTASCYSSNEGSARAFEKAGFVREGVRPAQFMSDEGPVDQIMLGLLRPSGMGDR
jgi:[ribosomal protein S5]-alanine N-acetyltransferase